MPEIAIGLARAGVLKLSVTLTEPQPRLRARVPRGAAGRAEAISYRRSWAAKHYWQEGPDVMVYEFDEPVPPGHYVAASIRGS